ncbi:MAG TPA: hypothetical protein VD996_01180 [Chitinophagaceae bacterium]|nr:hypothetical protein [Chitinophagaceae bacterium]
MRYPSLVIILLLFGALTRAQDSVQISSAINVIDGAFSYPAQNEKLNYHIAQKRTGSFLQLYRINADRTASQLTSDSANHSHAAIAANGKWLAYTKEMNGKRDIFILDLVSGHNQNLTNTPEFSEAHPSWAFNDSMIVFNSNQFDTLQEICSITLSGKKIRRITFNREEDTYASLSPDGTRLVYTKWFDDEKNPEIYIRALKGGEEMRLTNNSSRDVAPVWLSDSVVSYTRQGSIILHHLRTGAQKKLVSETGYLFGRGIPVSAAAMLCERSKDRRPDGLAIIAFQAGF